MSGRPASRHIGLGTIAAVEARSEVRYPDLQDALKVLLRLLAPSASEARGALERAIALADAQPRAPRGDADTRWSHMSSLALRQLFPLAESSPEPAGGASPLLTSPDLAALREAINRIGATASPHGHGPTDPTLLVLIRALPLELRRAVTLGTLYGLPVHEAAAVLGVAPRIVVHRRDEALRSLHDRLRQYASRQLVGVPLSKKAPPRLVPLPVSADGMAVIKGTRVYVDPNVPVGLVGALAKLLARLEERLRHVLHLPSPLDDDVGKSRRHQPLDPTPTTQPLRKPPPTPSLEPHRMPKPTGGTAVHRRAPQMTPSTQRLSARPRPAAAGSRAYTWQKR